MSRRAVASAVFGRRLCAAVAAGSAALHATMIGHAAGLVPALLIIAMATACLFCAYELWRGCGPRTWLVVAVMNLAMIAVHWSMPAHHHGTPIVGPAEPMPALMGLATAVSLTEAVIATAVLYALTRRRHASAIM
jgi:hypothetical protein